MNAPAVTGEPTVKHSSRVQGTAGAEWAVEMQVPASVHVVSKAIDPKSDAYSAFEGTALLDLLLARKIQRVFVAGAGATRTTAGHRLGMSHAR